MGHEVRYVGVIKERFTAKPINTFEIELTKKENNTKILELKHLGSQDIKVERQRKRTDPVQCHRCQAYGHSKNYCRRQFVCLKCGCKVFKDERNRLTASRARAVPSQQQLSQQPSINRRHHEAHNEGSNKRSLQQRQQQQQQRQKSSGNIVNNTMTYSQVANGRANPGRMNNPAAQHLLKFQQKLQQEQRQNAQKIAEKKEMETGASHQLHKKQKTGKRQQ
ncbi:putative cyclin-dependent serine/threonine-protein kinase DDB_G0272797/DDB_G0274007 [Drosophila montana]|uniref:putative cyclin-dependent serine/threonine-protein kinase DDB_G0272797/DDB_G0274007 n=1 Tax=Drosophila montana TaxID=40370 RepID=UPI00313D2464